MNRELGRAFSRMLLHHEVASTPEAEVLDLVDRCGPVDVAGLRPFSHLLHTLVQQELMISYEHDWDNYGHGLITVEQFLAKVSAATRGEWAPSDLACGYSDEDEAELVAFTFDGTEFHWEFVSTYGEVILDVVRTFDDFAADHLNGRAFNRGGVAWYLPKRLFGELTAFLEEVSWAWPLPDELVAIFRAVVPPPPAPDSDVSVWGKPWSGWSDAISELQEESSLEHINGLASSGERPLHALVQQARQDTHQALREERLLLIPDLIQYYHADPRLPDAAGSTAFDHADGDDELIAALSVSPEPDANSRRWGLWFTDHTGTSRFSGNDDDAGARVRVRSSPATSGQHG